MNILLSSLSIITILFLLTGCSQKSQPDPKMIKEYNESIKPLQANKTRINVIRKNTMLGAAAPFYIKCNEKIYSLSTGSSMTCTTKEDINTLSLMNGGLGSYNIIDIIPIDNRLNQEIFLYIQPLQPIKEINADYGKTLIIDFNKFIKGKEENPFNFDFDTFVLMNPGNFLKSISSEYISNYIESKNKYLKKFTEIVDNQYKKDIEKSKLNESNISKDYILDETLEKMTYEAKNNLRFDQTTMIVDKDNNNKVNLDESRIILFRNKDNGSSLLGIWNKNEFIGDLGVESFIDYRTKNNNLVLHSYYHNWRTLKLNLEKGKTYYINVDFDLGWNENTIEFLKVPENIFKESKDKLCKIKLDESKITPLLKKRLDKGSYLIKKEFPKD